ncbi:hypothetical protein [Nocardia pseudobrasiliensis]|uniref:Uncharacterized protein n=1 Tax=Nocardia pseudobrasiliensis TaxID=45979 RepID=A0A370I9P1_9NOCA|nr:hypothetical protein [Nocardia pseudobrasiliensis]RDI67360.1 hypothetical protein DFR76_103431 [Nocardia pseudobrasiliensis]
MRIRIAAGTILIVAATAVPLGVGTASAVSIGPDAMTDGTALSLTHEETAAVSRMRLGPAIAQLVPGRGWTPAGRADLAETLTSAADTAATKPGAYLFVSLVGDPSDPDHVDAGYREPTGPCCVESHFTVVAQQ